MSSEADEGDLHFVSRSPLPLLLRLGSGAFAWVRNNKIPGIPPREVCVNWRANIKSKAIFVVYVRAAKKKKKKKKN